MPQYIRQEYEMEEHSSGSLDLLVGQLVVFVLTA